MAQPKFTMVAAKAMSLAELFHHGFAAGLQGPVAFRVELATPDGPSTGAGKQALQHIKLIPVEGGSTTVIGSANWVERRAELRTFAHLAELHGRRFKGAALPIDPAAYEELSRSLANFFSAEGMTLTRVDAAPVEEAGRASRSSPITWVVLAILAATLGTLATAISYHYR